MAIDIPLVNKSFKDLNPLLCGQEMCESGHSFGPAVRSYYLIHYVFSGKGTFEHKGISYPIEAGGMFLIRPGEVTYYRADEQAPWHYAWIGFDGDTAGLLLAQTGFRDRCVLAAPSCASLFQTMLTAGDRPYSPEIFLCARLYDLLAELVELEKPQTGESPARRHVKRAEDYIQANYASRLSIAELAAKLNLDRRYLCRIFHQIKGVSPQAFLIAVRLDKAAALLQAGLSVGAAGRSVGYEDLFTFSRMFKRRFGISPSACKSSRTP